jgi:pantothenate kinase
MAITASTLLDWHVPRRERNAALLNGRLQGYGRAMASDSRPVVVAVAGPNGAGKSTVAPALLE